MFRMNGHLTMFDALRLNRKQVCDRTGEWLFLFWVNSVNNYCKLYQPNGTVSLHFQTPRTELKIQQTEYFKENLQCYKSQ